MAISNYCNKKHSRLAPKRLLSFECGKESWSTGLCKSLFARFIREGSPSTHLISSQIAITPPLGDSGRSVNSLLVKPNSHLLDCLGLRWDSLHAQRNDPSCCWTLLLTTPLLIRATLAELLRLLLLLHNASVFATIVI